MHETPTTSFQYVFYRSERWTEHDLTTAFESSEEMLFLLLYQRIAYVQKFCNRHFRNGHFAIIDCKDTAFFRYMQILQYIFDIYSPSCHIFWKQRWQMRACDESQKIQPCITAWLYSLITNASRRHRTRWSYSGSGRSCPRAGRTDWRLSRCVWRCMSLSMHHRQQRITALQKS